MEGSESAAESKVACPDIIRKAGGVKMVGPLRRKQGTVEVMDDAMAQVLREKTDAERFLIGNKMWVQARDMIQSMLRSEHPDWSEADLQRETARRLSHGSS